MIDRVLQAQAVAAGTWLRDMRTRRRLAQWELADEMGTVQAYISNLETGKASLLRTGPDFVQRLGVALDVTQQDWRAFCSALHGALGTLINANPYEDDERRF